MHTVLYLYLPWLLALLAGFFEFEITHKAKGILFGVHPIVPGVRFLLLCAFGMAGAAGLSYMLIYINHLLHLPPRGYELPWVVYIFYMFFLDERERRAARAAQRVAIIDQEED